MQLVQEIVHASWGPSFQIISADSQICIYLQYDGKHEERTGIHVEEGGEEVLIAGNYSR